MHVIIKAKPLNNHNETNPGCIADVVKISPIVKASLSPIGIVFTSSPSKVIDDNTGVDIMKIDAQ